MTKLILNRSDLKREYDHIQSTLSSIRELTHVHCDPVVSLNAIRCLAEGTFGQMDGLNEVFFPEDSQGNEIDDDQLQTITIT